MNNAYPKRLIEVDLPIKRISAHARREKSIRHGHISTLHIWWARRPLAACRAVVCAALWPDPADKLCPEAFRLRAAEIVNDFCKKSGTKAVEAICSAESWTRYQTLAKPGNRIDPANPDHQNLLRFTLLDFIADFAAWEASTERTFLATARALTQAAHEALGGEPGTRPLVVDPFAGGGAIPLEALRVGADAFASDLNPVAVLLNKVVLEYIPKYGQRLADEVLKWGQWVKEQAEKELAEFYPTDPDGATPIAYLWARTVTCEGPGCGAEVPLIRGLWLANKGKRSIALRIVPNPKKKRVDFEIVDGVKPRDIGEGTVARGSASCPCCGYTTPVESIRRQLVERRGGTSDARMLAVVNLGKGESGRFYRLPKQGDLDAAKRAAAALADLRKHPTGGLSAIPDELVSQNEIRRISVPLYGMTSWSDMFNPRQLLALATINRLIDKASREFSGLCEPGLAQATRTCLALSLSKEADLTNGLCSWKPDAECPVHMMARQAIGMVWDFPEAVATSDSSGSWASMYDRTAYSISRAVCSVGGEAHLGRFSATNHLLPNDSCQAIITDPPYYDAVPYAHLSDFFYVWLRRSLVTVEPDLFADATVPKDEEVVVDRPHRLSTSKKDIAFYERELTRAFAEGRRIVAPNGIGTVVFASKTTASWEAILKAVVEAGWIITGSWPIDTEMDTRVAAQGQARLASSVHLVCRPRENPDGSVRTDDVGNWRDVLVELPKRIHEWMPRLQAEGVVGADAIFACLGPGLEIFSRYSQVEKTSGEVVLLPEYLEHVWAAVSREALNLIFEGADATGFEEDARLTAMWLWTLKTGDQEPAAGGPEDSETDGTEDADGSSGKGVPNGYELEYDAARKIAQGLGAHLENLASLVEVKGDTARLLPVADRTKVLFGHEEGQAPAEAKRKKRREAPMLPGMGKALEEAEEQAGGWGPTKAPPPGVTVLDRVHQSMILFAAGRTAAMQRFLVDDGIGRDERFWRLANALSALYPSGTDEKRWVDGVLARKKGLGL